MSEALASPVSPLCSLSPNVVSLAAGAFAGASSEVLLFPLDSLKTRLQSRQGLLSSGGFRGIYKGVGTAVCGAAPASAIFFSTYEASKRQLAPGDNSILGYWGAGLLASVFGELAAGVYRVPMDLVKQRQQAGHGSSYSEIARGVRSTHRSVFLASYMASFTRDVTHSSLQFPLYEYLKLVLARRQGRRPGAETGCGCDTSGLPTWQAACCGSVAGVVSGLATTPLDVLRTRLNLRGSGPADSQCLHRAAAEASRLSPLALVREEVADIYRSRGPSGFFAGGTCRAAWLGLGGFIFLGSFEWAKSNLMAGPDASPPRVLTPAVGHAGTSGGSSSKPSVVADLRSSGGASSAEEASTVANAEGQGVASGEPPSRSRQLGPEPPPHVSLICGLLAGLSVDIPLHPLDTVKTRMQSPAGFAGSGGLRHIWSGVSAVLLVSVPGSAIFFGVYEHARHFIERRAPATLQGEQFAMARDAAAASLADISASVVRVPCEVIKQRMQALRPGGGPPLTFWETVGRVQAEGARGFFAGFGATAMREVPFAFIQMPLFEELKHRHPWTEPALATNDTGRLGLIGMQCGCLAGSISGVATTPLDAAKTRIMLTERRAERQGFFRTVAIIWNEGGAAGLFKGGLPRALHCGLGGALWLGAFEWSKLLMWGP